MDQNNILAELNKRIERLKNSKSVVLNESLNEKEEMRSIESEMNKLKSIIEHKRMRVNDLGNKIKEKTLLITEAERAYTKLLENANKLIEAIDDNERDDD